MKTTLVAITGTATAIPATIPAKFVRIREDGTSPSHGLIANILQDDGTFSADVTYPAGADITIHRFSSILAVPPDYAYKGQPAGNHAKIRTSDGGSVSLRVIEHEVLPKGNY